MNSTQRKPMHSCLVIVLCTGAGILLAMVASWGLSIYLKEPLQLPSQLPPPPSKAQAIVGAWSLGFNGHAVFIRAIDGNSYQYKAGAWSLATAPDNIDDMDCQPTEIQNIEAAAGKIENCRQVQVAAEVCPGGLVSYAITSEGDLWRLDIPQSCDYIIAIPLQIILTLLGLVVGVFIVIVRLINTINAKGQQEEPGSF